MSAIINRLFPEHAEVPRNRLYLDAPLASSGHDGLFLYTNFVTSLDGRIAALDPATGRGGVPSATANPADWRLFQELAGRADVLVTSGRYLRDFAAGTAQDVLPVGSGRAFADIRRTREERGLGTQPDVAVLSASLDFEVPRLLLDQGRRVRVLTVAGSDTGRRRSLERQGAEVAVVSDAEHVAGSDAHHALQSAGYRAAYCVAGPYVLRTFVAANLLDALFLTTVHRLLGGERYSTPLEGPLLQPASDFRLRWLYYDAAHPDGIGQTYARHDRVAIASA